MGKTKDTGYIGNKIKVDTDVTITTLAGAGTRMVTASPTGILSSQSIPAGGGNQTLQQVLTSGSTLTGNNTIAGGKYQLNIDNSLIMSIGSTVVQNENGTGGSGEATLSVTGTGTRMFWYPARAAFRAGYINGDVWDNPNIGRYSYAFGFSNKASGESSASWGEENQSLGIASTTFGFQNIASALNSTACGYLTIATRDQATSFGSETAAHGFQSTAFGLLTVADSVNSFVIGRSNIGGGDPINWVTTDSVFEIGIGSASGLTKANALTVLKSGNVGIGIFSASEKLHVAGNIRFSGALMPNNTAGTSGQVLTSAGAGTVPTWTTVSSGFADPLTTNGDIIARVAGATTRLAQGANGSFLGVSGGVLGYYTPTGGGDMILASAQTNTGAKTFLEGSFLLRNTANTFNGSFINTNTANRTYTLKDSTGTIPLLEVTNSYTAGAKQIFNSSTTTAGFAFGALLASDPSALSNGDVWYNNTLGKFRVREAGVTKDMVGGGGAVAGTDTQIIFNNAGAYAGSASLTWDNVNGTLSLLGTDTEVVMKGVTNEPPAPAADTLKYYSKKVAGRMVPKIKGPSGLDTPMQNAFWQNNITMWNPNTTSAGVWLGTQGAGTGTYSTQLPTTTSIYTSMKRGRWANVVTTANQVLGQRSSELMYFRGSVAGQGGFFFYTRVGFDVWTNGGRFFAGMATGTTVISADPSNLNHTVGFAVDAADNGAISFLTRDTTATKASTGMTIVTGKGYDCYIFCAPNSTSIGWRIVDINTGAETSGLATTTLPLNTTMLTANVLASNAAVTPATSIQIGINRIYIETDY